jgi:hypothetical protein
VVGKMRTNWFRAGMGCTFLLVTIVGCAPSATAREPYTATLTGSTASPWVAAPAGWSDIEARQNPGGCASRIVFANDNERLLVELAPVVVLDGPPGSAAEASTRWGGMSANLTSGQYRFEATTTAGCKWSVRIAVMSAH